MKIGMDMIEIRRIEKNLTDYRFLRRVYTEKERAYFGKKRKAAESAAGFFCAKEAFVKALGCGIGPVSLCEIEVDHRDTGEPFLRLYGNAAQYGANYETHLSITHHQTDAAAVVLLEDKK